MRFTLIKDIRKESAMKPILNGLLLFTFAYLIFDIFVTEGTLGLLPHSIEKTLFGDEENFLDPITQTQFLEYIHMQIFFIMMLLLTLSAVFARLSSKKIFSLLTINMAMMAALLTLLTLALTYLVSPYFLVPYVFTFFVWHISALFMTLYSLWALNFEASI